MFHYIIMIVTCLAVGVSMAIILTLFLKRLNKIEEARWGKKKETPKKKSGEKENAQEKIK